MYLIMKCDKEYIFLQNNERIWSCKASGESEAWLFFEQIKRLDVTNLKKFFKIKIKDNDNRTIFYRWVNNN